jgi:putative PIN family toxin of toxin-antitoxin system
MLALRLVIDTNVLVSAALKPQGLQRTTFLLATAKPARLYISATILDEYTEVLFRPELAIRRGLRQQFLQLIKQRSHSVTPYRRLDVTSDPDDNMSGTFPLSGNARRLSLLASFLTWLRPICCTSLNYREYHGKMAVWESRGPGTLRSKDHLRFWIGHGWRSR